MWYNIQYKNTKNKCIHMNKDVSCQVWNVIFPYLHVVVVYPLP